MKKLILVVAALFLITGIASGKDIKEKRKAREKAKTEEIQKLFDNRTLQFNARMAEPMGGNNIQLTSEYTLDIRNNVVTAYLPYFGVAYYAEYGGGEGGIKFSQDAASTDWQSSRKGYEVRMEVKAPKDSYVLRLFFSELGFASLTVTCQNRQPITFSGIVQAIPEKSK